MELLNKMELLKVCAESKIYKTDFNGKVAILKERIRKNYRREELDFRLRKERTRQETRMLYKLKTIGVKTPFIYFIDEKKTQIYMEYIDGEQAKLLLDNNLEIAKLIGRSIAKMHKNNIIHGDLTTSNVLVTNKFNSLEENIYFIDLGLAFTSSDIEDKAVDLLVFKRILKATHVKVFEKAWDLIIEGYTSVDKDGLKTIEHIKEVEKRAKYNH